MNLGRSCVAAAGGLLPTMFMWLLLAVIAGLNQAPSSNIPTPNLVKPRAPLLMGPIEVLVYLDPWFAGTILYWLALMVVALIGLVLWAGQSTSAETAKRSSLRVFLVSANVGLILAAPWMYAYARMIWKVTP